MVDLMKPFQIGYNIVNNQIADILVDELGTVIMLDQNALPKHSLGEDWGPNNLAKAYVAMKNFQMLPLDTSITNTENALNFQHFQVMNLEQTQRMLSRIQMANYFKQQCFEVIGITPQRLGQQIGQTNTATGVEQAIAGSYAQTEVYFMQHSDYLMPRVHQMRTDLAQFYHSKKPSIRLQYMTSADENVNFEINGTDLLLRDINVFCTTKANHRNMLEQMKQLAISNNTAGASIYDLGNVMAAETLAELTHVLKETDAKATAARQEEMQSNERMKQMEIEQRTKEKQMELDSVAMEKEKDRRRDLLVAEIKSAGYGAMQDIDKNMQSDYADQMDTLRKTDEFQQTMGLKQTIQSSKDSMNRQKLAIEQQKLAAMQSMKQTDLQIAKENKNKYDVKKTDKNKK
jgi:coenzyme F420-reducing hydrogenase delta subunit